MSPEYNWMMQEHCCSIENYLIILAAGVQPGGGGDSEALITALSQ